MSLYLLLVDQYDPSSRCWQDVPTGALTRRLTPSHRIVTCLTGLISPPPRLLRIMSLAEEDVDWGGLRGFWALGRGSRFVPQQSRARLVVPLIETGHDIEITP